MNSYRMHLLSGLPKLILKYARVFETRIADLVVSPAPPPREVALQLEFRWVREK